MIQTAFPQKKDWSDQAAKLGVTTIPTKVALANDCPALAPSVFVRLFEPLPAALARRLLFAFGTGSWVKTKPMKEFWTKCFRLEEQTLIAAQLHFSADHQRNKQRASFDRPVLFGSYTQMLQDRCLRDGIKSAQHACPLEKSHWPLRRSGNRNWGSAAKCHGLAAWASEVLLLPFPFPLALDFLDMVRGFDGALQLRSWPTQTGKVNHSAQT